MENGFLKFYDDFVVKPGFTTSELKKIFDKYSLESVVLNGTFESYKTKPIVFYSENVIATLYFESGVIVRVTIYFVQGGSWSNNSEQHQQQKKYHQDQWLYRVIKTVPPYNFPWGTIESVSDKRSGFGGIVISYK